MSRVARFFKWLVFAAASRPSGYVKPPARKWRHIAIAIAIAVAALLPQGADARDPDGYVYRAVDGSAHFRFTPCEVEEILAIAPPNVRPRLRGLTAKQVGYPDLQMCWLEREDGLLVVGPQGPTVLIPHDHPNLAPETGL